MPRAWDRAPVSKLLASKGAALEDQLLRLCSFVMPQSGKQPRQRCVSRAAGHFVLRPASPQATVGGVKVSILRFVLLASLASLGCESSEPDVERRGGEIPDTGGTGGGSAAPTGGSDAGGPVPFCQALVVIRAKCQRCHGEPLQNAAPVPFLTYEDTQAQYYDEADKKFSAVMLSVVERDVMPYVSLNEGPTPIMPPVEPLTAEEKATLLGWLKQGALPEGGTDCP